MNCYKRKRERRREEKEEVITSARVFAAKFFLSLLVMSWVPLARSQPNACSITRFLRSRWRFNDNSTTERGGFLQYFDYSKPCILLSGGEEEALSPHPWVCIVYTYMCSAEASLGLCERKKKRKNIPGHHRRPLAVLLFSRYRLELERSRIYAKAPLTSTSSPITASQQVRIF